MSSKPSRSITSKAKTRSATTITTTASSRKASNSKKSHPLLDDSTSLNIAGSGNGAGQPTAVPWSWEKAVSHSAQAPKRSRPSKTSVSDNADMVAIIEEEEDEASVPQTTRRRVGGTRGKIGQSDASSLYSTHHHIPPPISPFAHPFESELAIPHQSVEQRQYSPFSFFRDANAEAAFVNSHMKDHPSAETILNDLGFPPSHSITNQTCSINPFGESGYSHFDPLRPKSPKRSAFAVSTSSAISNLAQPKIATKRSQNARVLSQSKVTTRENEVRNPHGSTAIDSVYNPLHRGQIASSRATTHSSDMADINESFDLDAYVYGDSCDTQAVTENQMPSGSMQASFSNYPFDAGVAKPKDFMPFAKFGLPQPLLPQQSSKGGRILSSQTQEIDDLLSAPSTNSLSMINASAPPPRPLSQIQRSNPPYEEPIARRKSRPAPLSHTMELNDLFGVSSSYAAPDEQHRILSTVTAEMNEWFGLPPLSQSSHQELPRLTTHEKRGLPLISEGIGESDSNGASHFAYETANSGSNSGRSSVSGGEQYSIMNQSFPDDDDDDEDIFEDHLFSEFLEADDDSGEENDELDFAGSRYEYGYAKISATEMEQLFEEAVENGDMEGDQDVVDHSSSFVEKGPKARPRWFNPFSPTFSLDQLETLKSQLQDSLQLSAQAYSIDMALKGPAHLDTIWWKNSLENMLRSRDEALQHNPDSILNISTLDRVNALISIPTLVTFNERKHLIELYEERQSQRKINRIRMINRNKANADNVASPASTSTTTGFALQASENVSGICLPETVKVGFNGFVHRTELLPEIYPLQTRTGPIFTPNEDKLLCIGIRMFGFSDGSSIRAHCLPSKTVDQVERRIRNSVRRKEEKSELKRLYLQPFRPLLIIDKELLLQGILKFGKSFRNCARLLFLTSPQSFTTDAWEELYRIGLIKFPCPKVSVKGRGKSKAAPRALPIAPAVKRPARKRAPAKSVKKTAVVSKSSTAGNRFLKSPTSSINIADNPVVAGIYNSESGASSVRVSLRIDPGLTSTPTQKSFSISQSRRGTRSIPDPISEDGHVLTAKPSQEISEKVTTLQNENVPTTLNITKPVVSMKRKTTSSSSFTLPRPVIPSFGKPVLKVGVSSPSPAVDLPPASAPAV